MRKLIISLFFTACLALALPCLADEYMMQAGDNVQIQVMGHSDLTGTYVARTDGKFEYPLIGTVDVKGKTVEGITEELKERLAEFIVNPLITINIVKMGSTRVFVLGEVRHAGLHELTKSHRALDAIGAANGFTDKAAKKKVYLIRNGKEDNIQFLNFNAYLKKGDVSQNPVLQEGDCLYLTSNHKFNFGRDVLPFIESWYFMRRADKKF